VSSVRIGGLARAELREALTSAAVSLNESAERLLANSVFGSDEARTASTIEIVQCSVRDLGLLCGATLPQILAAAGESGLQPCPPYAGPYLRLAMLDQPNAPDSVMSKGRAPSGSITIASERLRPETDFPRGFYLRVVDGQRWLRGYRCTDDALWLADVEFAFRAG
jgi:hypothetical protein